MRRLVFIFTLSLLAVPLFGALAPAVHAQTPTTMPAVAVSQNPVQTGQTTTVTGSGFTPNYYAYVFYQRPDATTGALNVVTDTYGNFSFTLGFSSTHGTGTEYLRAYDYGTARYTNTVAITVTGTAPPTNTPTLTVDHTIVTPGQVVNITGTGFSPQNYVYFIYQRPDGTQNAFYKFTDANGTFAQQLGFLRSHGCGTEYVEAYNYGTSSWSNLLTITVTGC